MNRYLLASAGAALLTWAPLASAQVSPPIEDAVIQGEILNRSVGQATDPLAPGSKPEDNEIDGEAGIYVLTVNEIFQISGGGGIGYTDNPTRTATDPGGAWYSDLGAGIGVATRLGGAVDFGLSANIGAREFLDDDGPSSQSVSTAMSVGAPIAGPVYANIIAFGGRSFEDGFDDSTSFYGLSANVSAAFPLSQKFLVRPGIGITQQWSEVSENDSLTATASVDVVYAFSPAWLLSGRISVSQRKYDDFYEDVTFVEREDTVAGISASLVYRPSKTFTVAVGAAYEDQDSSFFLSEFDALDSGVNVSVRHTF
jgi:hypothetical protein